MILGVVLAGGASTRFGSDKALAQLGGQTLLARATETLALFTDMVIVVGRAAAPVTCLPDWPEPGLGPLGGIAAALRHAGLYGYDLVLTCGVDSAQLPDNLLALLGPAPAYLIDQPVIGLWPVDAFPVLCAILAGDGRHSMRAFADAIGARAVQPPTLSANINTPTDLAALEHRHGL